MALEVRFDDPRDAARVIDALLDQADEVEVNQPMLARRYRDIADRVGDALGDLPRPRPWQV